MSFVVIPKSDWQNILNSVRAKTGRTALLLSGEVALEIDSITGSGGGNVPDTPTTRLPSEYQEVAWVQIVNSEQWDVNSCVRTGIMWNQANKIVVKVQNINTTTTSDMFFASWANETLKDAPYVGTNGGNIMCFTSDLSGYSVSPNNIPTSNADANEFTLTFSASAAKEITFGTWNDGAYSHPHKWCKVEIYNGDTLLGNFIPCYRKSDNLNGFYDLVSETFCKNAISTYDFTFRGSDITA